MDARAVSAAPRRHRGGCAAASTTRRVGLVWTNDQFTESPADILARLAELRAADAPTHGGRVLSYVYDSGLAELDELAAEAIRAVQPVNGLDPTTFTSVAVSSARSSASPATCCTATTDVVGIVTTGGTESCLLAVKTARDAVAHGRIRMPWSRRA